MKDGTAQMILGVKIRKAAVPELYRLARINAGTRVMAGIAHFRLDQVYYIQQTHRASVSDKLNSGGFLLL